MSIRPSFKTLGQKKQKSLKSHLRISYVAAKIYLYTLMGEGFIHLTRGYGFMGGGLPPPFDTLKKCTFAYDMNLKLYK